MVMRTMCYHCSWILQSTMQVCKERSQHTSTVKPDPLHSQMYPTAPCQWPDPQCAGIRSLIPTHGSEHHLRKVVSP